MGADTITLQKCLAWILACPSQREAAERLDHRSAGLGTVCARRSFLSIFSFTGPRKLSAPQAVLQLHLLRFGIYLHRHGILASAQKNNAFLEATVYSLKAPHGTETSEKGKQTVLFHATPIINIPALAKHL